MGYLLKEALKTLCGVNQWSYAVYWKIGCQNPKLLIWEDCYCEPTSCSGILGDGTPQTLDNLHFLVNKMMVDSQINIVGQGLVGRVAFTGNHQWLLSDNIFKETCPPEVLKEVFQQFSAGMQTVAVIPVLPHGVVQFASYNTIMENMGFVQHVKSLVCQLGHVPGVLLSQNYAAKELDPKTEVPECFGNPTPGDFYLQSNFINDSYMFDNRLNYSSSPAQSSVFECQTSHSLTKGIQNDLTSIIAAFQASNSSPSYLKPQDYSQNSKINSAVKLDFPPQNQIMNGVAKAEVISPNTGMQMNQLSSQFIPRSNQDLSSCSSSMLNHDHFSNPNVSAGAIMPEPKTNSGVTYSSKDGYVTFPSFEASGLCQGVSSIMEPSSGTICTPVVKRAAVENISAVNPYKLKNVDFGEGDNKKKNGGQIHIPNTTRCDDALVQPQSGDDLFDILGANFKNNLFSTSWNSSLSSESAPNVHNWDKNNSPCKAPTEVYTESTIFTMPADTDHLLDVVVSKVHHSGKQSLNDNVSCKTTLTNISSSSTGITSLPYGRFGVSDKLRGELLGIPKYQATSQAVSSGPFKEDSVTYSQGSTIYGSQVSSLFGKGQNVRQSNSVPTEYSKKPDETAKTNRKRSKPGENPRPRPKDRQMIQDRVKELREIVPNGGKCSIDALLERTIKHMLFLQSVTKHADKLKQTEESKIISKDGGLLMKDNFEGGATWAYEVGSQSMVCPIIVEDLNQPRQMLVEILCEERGLFLEIADIIRGMGLTILKGVMETRNDKIWARFSVEANRDVTRMEIFLSLVRLLEQTAKNCASQSSENTVLQQLHQAPSVPTSYDQ